MCVWGQTHAVCTKLFDKTIDCIAHIYIGVNVEDIVGTDIVMYIIFQCTVYTGILGAYY